MKLNPVFREGIQIYLIEGHGFGAYCVPLIILAPLQLLILFLPSLDRQTWIGPANLFKLSSVAALMLLVYFVLRVANQEFASWRFLPLKRWLQQEGVGIPELGLAHFTLLCIHVFLFVLLSSPLLIWAGAIARVSGQAILSTLLLLLFYSLIYGLWGLVALGLWERKMESRQVFVRAFFVSVVFLSALFHTSLNPIAFLLSNLERKDLAPLLFLGWKWSAPFVHFLFHVLLLVSGLTLYRWSLKREVSL